jgi:hypothetical protein
MLKRNVTLAVSGLFLLVGCQSQPDYTFSGRLLKPDGSPASGMSVIVTPASAAITGDPKGTVVTTDDGGGFTGSFANDMDGTDWPQVPLPQMPPLSGVYLWIYDRYQWKPIPVSINPLEERERCSGGQQIVLPTVNMLPVRLHRLDTVPAETAMPSSPTSTN